jgi:hypothetical protein
MTDDRRSTHLLCGQIHVRGSEGDDEEIAQLAKRQHGVVTRRQLAQLGVGRRSIDHRLATGRLRRLFPGGRSAYAVGHEALSLQAHALAGVIAAGPGGAASHWTKLALHTLIEKPRPLIHVTAPEPRRPRKGLFIHRAMIPPDELEITDGIPSLSLPRTFLDLSADLDDRPLRTLLKRAEFRGLVSGEGIVEILERYPRRRGRKCLARIARGYALAAGRTASPLEDDFLEFCGQRGIPIPESNVSLWIAGRYFVIDCLWRDARLAVELDGRTAHERRLAFEDDRARDRALTVAGWRPVRVTSAQLRFGAAELERDLLQMITTGDLRTQEVRRSTLVPVASPGAASAL